VADSGDVLFGIMHQLDKRAGEIGNHDFGLHRQRIQERRDTARARGDIRLSDSEDEGEERKKKTSP